MEENNSRGLDFPKTLTIALIVLKLCKVITISWIWVISPLWIAMILTVIFSVIEDKYF
jgi:hypothetical protein